MNQNISALLQRIRTLEDELEIELARRRTELHFTLQERKVRFEQFARQQHQQLRRGLFGYVFGSRPLILLTAPVIYAMIIPVLVLDVFFTLYQYLCFPVYGIKRVKRGDYLHFDRKELGYLNMIEKLNCQYCAYSNGILAYAREIAGLTEQYWCPIKHAHRVRSAHAHYHDFIDYGDAEAYQTELKRLRKALKDKITD